MRSRRLRRAAGLGTTLMLLTSNPRPRHDACTDSAS